jgi:predicted RNase H-like HicB family nuclease
MHWRAKCWHTADAKLKIVVRANRMMFHVKLEHAEDGWIVAEVPALPGCVSQGRDEREALENVKEAISAWMWAEDQKAVREIDPSQLQLVVAV